MERTLSKNSPKQPEAGATPEGAAAVTGTAEAVAAAQAAAQSAAQAQAAAERIQSAVQDLAVQLAQSAQETQVLLGQAKELMAEAIESHNAVVATLESDAVSRDEASQRGAGDGSDAPDAPAMTAAEAARLVRRRKVIEAPGAQPRVIESPVGETEVLSFKDHGTHVVVVTVDGQKFISTAAAA